MFLRNKLLLCILGIALCAPVFADTDANHDKETKTDIAAGAAEKPKSNIFFGDKQNQVSFTLGQGFDSGELILFLHMDRPAPYYMLNFSYSQPTTFFRLPARQTINLVKTIGFGSSDYDGKCGYRKACNWEDYGAEIFMLSEDFALYHTTRWYFGAGGGVAVQGRYNERLNTKFLLGFRMFAGYKFSEYWATEFVMQHFSNGDTGTRNLVYDFYGLSAVYSF